MEIFVNDNIKFEVLKHKAFNYRWAEVEDGVIPLTAADPDFPAAPEIIEALQDYLKDGYLSYTPKLGYPELKRVIADDFNSRKNEHVSQELVLPIDSAARGMYLIAQTVLSEGDEAIVMDPVDYLFKNSVLSAGGVPVYYPTRPGNEIDFKDLENYITPKTKMFCLCNPHNPLGRLYSKENLDRLLSICEKHGLWIMNDEIWSDIVLGDRPFISINSFGPERNRRTITVYGFSKAYGLAGLRAGCVFCMENEIFDKIVDKSGVLTTAGGVCSLSQVAAIAAIQKARYWNEAFIRHLRANLDYALERLSQMPMLSVERPEATYVIWINIKKTGMGSQELVDFIHEKTKVALVAGSEKMFGPGAEGYIRLCYATSREVLKEGLDRFEKGLKLLEK